MNERTKTDDELKDIVAAYILGTLQSDAADGLYEVDALFGEDDEWLENDYQRCLWLFASAEVTVKWPDSRETTYSQTDR